MFTAWSTTFSDSVAYGRCHDLRCRFAAKIRRVHLFGRDSLDRLHETSGRFFLAEMVQHHRCGPERCDRICDALAGNIEGGTVYWLEHRRKFALGIQIRRRCDTEASR